MSRPYLFVCLLEIVCTISLFIYNLVGAIGRALASWGTRIEGRWGSVGIPQGDVHKSLTRHQQQIFSYRMEEVVSLKYHHLNIRPDIAQLTQNVRRTFVFGSLMVRFQRTVWERSGNVLGTLVSHMWLVRFSFYFGSFPTNLLGTFSERWSLQ